MVSGGEWQTKFNVSPGPGLWSLVLGPFGPDLGPDLDLTLELDLDLSLTKEFKLVHLPQSESVKVCEVRNKKLNYLQPCECKKIQRSINCAPTFLSVPCLDTKLIAMKLSVERRKILRDFIYSVEEIQDIYKVSNNIC